MEQSPSTIVKGGCRRYLNVPKGHVLVVEVVVSAFTSGLGVVVLVHCLTLARSCQTCLCRILTILRSLMCWKPRAMMILVHCLNALVFLTWESLWDQLSKHLSSWDELPILVVLEMLTRVVMGY